jgi:hypothetical protein
LDAPLDGSHSTPWTLDISKNVGSCPRLMHALVVNPQGQCGQWSSLMGNLIESPSNKRKSHLTRKATLKKDLYENNISWLILAAKLLKRSRMWERNRAVEESSIIYSKPPSRCVGMALSQTISFPTPWSFPLPASGAVSAPCKATEVKEISASHLSLPPVVGQIRGVTWELRTGQRASTCTWIHLNWGAGNLIDVAWQYIGNQRLVAPKSNFKLEYRGLSWRLSYNNSDVFPDFLPPFCVSFLVILSHGGIILIFFLLPLSFPGLV